VLHDAAAVPHTLSERRKVRSRCAVEQRSAMDLRLFLSRFADAEARKGLARWLIVLCGLGCAATLVALAALGYADRWIFVLVVWVVLLFIPLRIGVEALQTVGARMRDVVGERVATDPRRYERSDVLPIIADRLFATRVTMPRIAKPQQSHKAREAAAAILHRTAVGGDTAGRLAGAIRLLLAAAGSEAVALSATATGVAAEDIQARWEGARALSALAALTQVLVAAYAERWGTLPPTPELGDRPLDDYLEAALDYCDEAALKIDALPWTEPPLRDLQEATAIDDVRATWRAFANAGIPAPRALRAFLDAVLPGTAV
jgi:hypothetical protein